MASQTQSQGAALGGVTAAFTPTNAAQAAALAEVNRAFAPIPATSMQQSQTPATVPPVPATNYSTAINGANATIGANNTSLSGANTTPSNDPWALLNQYLGSQTPPPSAASQYQTDYNAAGIDQKQAQANQDAAALKAAQAGLNATTAQIQGLTAEGTAQKLLQENTFGTTGNTIGQQAQIDRNYAVKAIPLQIQALAQQAQVAAAQGNAQLSQSILNQAQQHMDAVYQIHQQDATNQYNYQKSLRDSVFQFATQQQQNELAAAQKKADQVFTTQQNDLNYAQGLATSAISAGLPGVASKILALDPTSSTYRADVGKLAKQIAPKATTATAPTIKTINGVDMQWNPATQSWETPTGAVSGGAQPQSAYQIAGNQRIVDSVDALIPQVSDKTAGFGGKLAGYIPGTDAYNFKSQLDTLKANIAFGALTQMREASKTGGALGQISDAEERLLSSTLGSIDPGQSPEVLKAQLQKVKDSITRWDAAASGQQSGQSTVTVNGSQYTVGQVYQDKTGARWTVDAQGNWKQQ